jgi:hypothetical protein
MSQQNVEVRNEAVQRFISAFEGDDEAFRETLHPEIEWYPIEENRTPTRGVEAALWNRMRGSTPGTSTDRMWRK